MFLDPLPHSDHDRRSFSLFLPEVRNVAKVLFDPAIRVDRVEITLAFIGKDRSADRAGLNLILDLIDRHQHCARRATSENRLITYETAASDNTIKIADADTTLGNIRLIERRPNCGAVAWNQTLAAHAPKDHAPNRIACEDPDR